MIIISHRGNINGPNTAYFGENDPASIKAIIKDGYHVEVDIRFINNKFFLGHDNTEHEVDETFFYNDRLWVHCKNIEALYKLKSNPIINAFFHEEDRCSLTSKGYIWTYPKKQILTNQSIAVLPEIVEDWDISSAFGICTDFPIQYIKN